MEDNTHLSTGKSSSSYRYGEQKQYEYGSQTQTATPYGHDHKISALKEGNITDHHSSTLPPITTETLPTPLQLQIANQTWDKVSAREPIGSSDNAPDIDTFIDYLSTILEMRLAEVVKHRREAKQNLTEFTNPSSVEGASSQILSSSLTSFKDDNWEMAKRPSTPTSGEEDSVSRQSSTSTSNTTTTSAEKVLLTSTCRIQLRAYVRHIASMYRNNKYHGLEHAVHVTMSANKLLDMLHCNNNDNEGESSESRQSSSSSSSSFPSSSSIDETGERTYKPPTSDVPVHPNAAKHPAMTWPAGSDRACITRRDSKAVLAAAGAAAVKKGYKFSRLDHYSARKKKAKSKHTHHPHRIQHKLSSESSHCIYSDMFTKFAFVFAAMIHDVDHQGVPNARLAKEQDPLIDVHGSISTAEKHSIQVAFKTLSESDYEEFRNVVFDSPEDQLQMHRIVFNVVISTDIASAERGLATKERWDEAFNNNNNNNNKHQPTLGGSASSSPSNSSTPPLPLGRLSLAGKTSLSEIATVQASKPQIVSMQNTSSVTTQHHHPHRQQHNQRKRTSLQLNGGQTVEYFTEFDSDDDDNDSDSDDAEDKRMALQQSVIIETMLNVADVAHSMQSWELFVLWNKRLFEELYEAYKSGRSDTDPSDGWYENQVGFYSMYVIPLAEKMKKCGVFGQEDVSGEWVKNAIEIRDRWRREGEEITRDMIDTVKRELM